jgi:hypothetical protein
MAMERHPSRSRDRKRARSGPGGHGAGAAGPLAEADLLDQLTPRQRRDLGRHWRELQEHSRWSESLPVLLLDRCWLRLSVESLAGLARRLPPDASGEAPELARYRELRQRGLGGWEAQLLCWEEFGPEACREAQRRFWIAREAGNRGWTLERYLALRAEYRQRWRLERPRRLPLLVLGREGADGATGGEGEHQLLWLCPAADEPERPMRHTCP